MRTLATKLSLTLSLIVACSESPKDTEQFATSWSESMQNSAVSYYYDGETDDYYRIVEKWPNKKLVTYHVSKDAVVLTDVPRHESNSGNLGIPLKYANLRFATE